MKLQAEITTAFDEIIWKRKFTNKDLLSIDDLNDQELDIIMDLAKMTSTILNWEQKKVNMLKWRTHLNFFMENSTRTRTSFELAWKNLWADVINISASASSMTKWETLLDTSITLDQMQADIIVARAPDAWTPHFIAKNVKASVINAWDWWNEHPTQALLDIFTLKRMVSDDLRWKNMLIVWDTMHSRVFWSLVRICKRLGINLTVSSPHTLVQPNIDQWWAKHEPDLEKALKWKDIIYVLRLQTERAAWSFVPSIREYSKCYWINAKRLALANKDAVVMHPWPVIREMDLHTNVLETDRCLVEDQVFSWYCVRFVLLWLYSNNRHLKTVKARPF